MLKFVIRTTFALMIAGLAISLVAAQGTTEVAYQLSWVHEYSAAPFYLAKENGHFADAGLDVTLLEGGFQDGAFVDGLESVLNGTAQFGAVDGSTLLRARADGKPVVAIATVTQRSPFSLISLADQQILTPQDLVGKTVSVTDGGARMIYDALLTSQDIDPETVNTVSRETFGIDPLINGDVDVLGGWLINEGVQVEEAGSDYNFILMSDYGVDSYDFVIFTTEDMIDNNPDIVQGFLQALTLGLRDFIHNPQQAAEVTVAYNSDLDYDEQLRRIEAMIPLVNIYGKNPGEMDPAVWDFTQEILLENSVLEEPIDLETVYNTSFLDAIYNQ